MLSSNVLSIDQLGLYGLTDMDDKTIGWVLNTAPRSSAAKQCILSTRLNDENARYTRLESIQQHRCKETATNAFFTKHVQRTVQKNTINALITLRNKLFSNECWLL